MSASAETVALYTFVILNLRLATAVVSSVATSINILLIYDMSIFNGHINLILSMSIYQLLNDACSALVVYPTSSLYYAVGICFVVYGGLASGIVSNFMMIRLFRIVTRKATLNDASVQLIVHSVCAVPCLAIVGVIGSAYMTNDLAAVSLGVSVYNILRIISIFINIASLAVFAAWRSRRKILAIQQWNTNKAPIEFLVQFEKRAINELIRRLIYYPFFQVVSRAAASIQLLAYGSSQNGNNRSTSIFILSVFHAILLTVGAVGFLFTFLYLQPNAWKHLVSRMTTGKRYVPLPPPNLRSSLRSSKSRRSSKIPRGAEIERITSGSLDPVDSDVEISKKDIQIAGEDDLLIALDFHSTSKALVRVSNNSNNGGLSMTGRNLRGSSNVGISAEAMDTYQSEGPATDNPLSIIATWT